jgi:hypothetical protein
MIHFLTSENFELFGRGSACTFMINEFNSLGKICSVKFYLTHSSDAKHSKTYTKWFTKSFFNLKIAMHPKQSI